jgi:hypothetical protein
MTRQLLFNIVVILYYWVKTAKVKVQAMYSTKIYRNSSLILLIWALVLLLLPVIAKAQAGIEIQRTPDNGLHPRMFQDADGAVHLLYFRKRSNSPRSREGDLFYRQWDTAEGDWGTAIRVSSKSFNYADPIYRANFDIDNDGRIHVVWYTARPSEFMYTRSSPERSEFGLQRSLVSENLEGIDAGADITVSDNNVAVVWAAGALTEEDQRTVYARYSTDYGETFSNEIMLGDKSLGACACCSLAVEHNQQDQLIVAYRSAIDGVGRHMQLLSIDPSDVNQEKNYASLHALQQWDLSACPVTTNDFGEDYQQNDWLVFESESRIVQMNITAGTDPELVAEPTTRTRQKHPSIAFSSDGYKLITWGEGISFTKGGTLDWQLFDNNGEPVEAAVKQEVTIPDNSSPAAVVTPAGSFLILY